MLATYGISSKNGQFSQEFSIDFNDQKLKFRMKIKLAFECPSHAKSIKTSGKFRFLNVFHMFSEAVVHARMHKMHVRNHATQAVSLNFRSLSGNHKKIN